jgi:hypothetical protein
MNPRPLFPFLLFGLGLAFVSPCVLAQDPPPEGFAIEGTVYLGKKPVAARLEFLEGGGGVKRETASDLAGRYRLEAAGVLRQVKIELPEREGKFFYEFFAERIETAGTRDFRLPDTELSVKVIDAITEQGVPAAGLRLRNTYRLLDPAGRPLPPKKTGAALPTSSVSQSEKTGENGAAFFYYLRPGEIEIVVEAEGYHQAEAPIKFEIAPEDAKHVVEMRLQPQSKKAGLHILLPNGQPAVGAQVRVLAGLDPFEPLASATAGQDGEVRLPEEHAGAWLSIHHPGAAFHLGRWNPAAGPQKAEIQLEKAAEKPLRVQAKKGGEKLAYAEVVLWAGGRRLATQLLYQLTGAKPMTDEEGIFTAATSLPRGEVKILVFSRQNPTRADQARSGRLDAAAAPIPYPWPELVEVEGLDD